MKYQNETEFRHDAPEMLGVLLVNLGTPDAPTVPAVRRYLAEFLSDPRVVELPRPLWWLILHGIICGCARAAPPRPTSPSGPSRARRCSSSHGARLRPAGAARAQVCRGRYGSSSGCATATHRSRRPWAICAGQTCAGCWCCPFTPSTRPPPQPPLSRRFPGSSRPGAGCRRCAS